MIKFPVFHFKLGYEFALRYRFSFWNVCFIEVLSVGWLNCKKGVKLRCFNFYRCSFIKSCSSNNFMSSVFFSYFKYSCFRLILSLLLFNISHVYWVVNWNAIFSFFFFALLNFLSFFLLCFFFILVSFANMTLFVSQCIYAITVARLTDRDTDLCLN